MKPIIVTCAPTGGIHTPSMSPHLPITPSEIATAAIEAAQAGAAIVHLHARDPETGRPDPRPETFNQFLPVIKQSTNAVVNISTGGTPSMPVEERMLAATSAAPEMASLNMGSMNFGLFPLADRFDWQHDWERPFLEASRDMVFPNTFATIEYALRELGEKRGTRFEFECYDLGHLYTLKHFVDRGLVKPPFFIQMVFGILGGMGADLDNLIHLHRTAERLFGPENFEWSVLAAGKNQMAFATQAAMMGGNLRVGLEDSLYIGKGELATSNAQQVLHIREIVERLGRTLATPDEARERLGLKGGDKTAF